MVSFTFINNFKRVRCGNWDFSHFPSSFVHISSLLVLLALTISIYPSLRTLYYSQLDNFPSFFNQGDIIITTLPPIPTTGLTKLDVEELMERTYNVMLTHYTQTSKEVQEKFKMQQIQQGGGNLDKLIKSDNIIDDYSNKQNRKSVNVVQLTTKSK